MKLSGLTKMVKRQLVCNVFHNDESDDFYIGIHGCHVRKAPSGRTARRI